MVKKKYSSKNSNRNGNSTLRRRNRRNKSKRAGMKSFGNLAASVKSFSSKLQEGRNLKRQIKSAKNKESGHLKGLNLNALRSLNTNTNSNTNFRSVTALNVDSTCKSKYVVPEQCVGNTDKKRKQHYRKQSMIFHPDKNKGCIVHATEKFKLLEKCCKSKDSGKFLGEC